MVYTPNPSWPLPALPEHNVLALLSGSRWASNRFTYSFPDLRSDYSSGNSAADGFQAANAADQNAVRSILEGDGLRTLSGYMALTSVEQVTSLDLVFAGYNASDISVSTNTDLAQSFAYYPVNGGDVWLRSDIAFPQVGSYSYYLILHELGHSLGLKHGHEADSAVGATNETVLTYDRDTKEFSVMTYRNHIGDNDSYFEDDAEGPSTLMMYDIAALQYLYGADFETNSTDTVYSFDPQSGQVFLDNDFLYAKGDALGDTIFMTIWDGGGIDTYDLTYYTTDSSIDLAPGGWSIFSEAQLANLGDGYKARGNVFNALQYLEDPRSLIENVTAGAGNDDIRGNAARNTLNGNYGDDTLFGADGNDRLIGGSGADHLRGGEGADFLDGGAGAYDTVEYSDATTSVSVNLGTNTVSGGIATGDRISGFENIIGGAHGDILYGSSGANVILGNSGADQIVGSGGEDYLAGENGDDMIIVNEGGSATMVGGSGKDMFVVFPGTHAKILDFVAGPGVADQLFIYKNVFSSFEEVYAASYEFFWSTYIVKDGFSIELVGVTLAQLHPNDFNFLNI